MSSPVLAGFVQVTGLLFVSFLYPYLQEKKRIRHEKWTNSIKEKEKALSVFSKYISETILIQATYKHYIFLCEQSKQAGNTSDADSYRTLMRQLHFKFIDISTPYDAACNIAKLEFEDLKDTIDKIENSIKTYIDMPSYTKSNEGLTKNKDSGKQHHEITDLYEKIISVMTQEISNARKSSPGKSSRR